MLGLENLFAWVPQLIDWFCSWLPTRGRLGAHEQGVRVRAAKTVALKPGTYWFWPRWSEVFVENVKRKVTDITEQTLTTQDRKRVRVGGILIYHITNIVTWVVENEDPEHGILTDAARVLRDFIRTHDFAEIQKFNPAGRNDDDLTKLAQGELGQTFGVRIRFLGMTTFAETRAIDLTHSGSIGGIKALPEPMEEH